MNSAAEFLTPEECAEVDKALLTSQGKFTTRVAIYALRSLKTIAQQENCTIADLQPDQIEDWIYQDESLQDNGGLLETREASQKFRQFFCNLVISSIKPLKQAAQELEIQVEQLTVPQVIAWFEADAKKRL
jgi:hypothetical protein